MRALGIDFMIAWGQQNHENPKPKSPNKHILSMVLLSSPQTCLGAFDMQVSCLIVAYTPNNDSFYGIPPCDHCWGEWPPLGPPQPFFALHRFSKQGWVEWYQSGIDSESNITDVIFKFESSKRKTHKIHMNNNAPCKIFKKYDFLTKKLKNKQSTYTLFTFCVLLALNSWFLR
jgi:hypothetical protein